MSSRLLAPKRALLVGAGGMAANWVRHILPPFRQQLAVVGLVDIRSAALAASGDFLELPAERRFLTMADAFEAVDADCCIIVVPAAFHPAAAVLAAEHGLDILCEKPLASTWEGCVEIARAVRRAGVKMEVVQNYRYRAPMLAMTGILASGELGRLNYLVARFADDCRDYDAWARRHELPHAMLMDGAAHHFDMLRNLAGADCAQIAALEWNPPWSSSKGEFCALCILRMTNGAHASYEGNATTAGQQNPWRHEAYRAECEAGAVSVDAEQVVRVYRHRRGRGLESQEVAAPVPAQEGHAWIVAEFLDWLDGGPTPATCLDDNLQTAAMVFGAIESARSGQSVDVAAMVQAALGEAAVARAADC